MTRGLNGETVLKFEDVTIGHVDGADYGYKRNPRLTISVDMERLDRSETYETTDHRQVAKPLDFAITYGVWQGTRMVEGGAGVREALGKLVDYAPGWDASKVTALRRLTTWHLNSMNAGCDHQTPVRDDRGRPDLDATESCPITGYKYGHASLLRELPDGFEASVRALFE